jgi:hypothetical protein
MYTVLFVGKPEGKRLLRRPRHRWEDNIRMDLREIRSKVWAGCIWLRVGSSGRLL